jgi:hypothetical protein
MRFILILIILSLVLITSGCISETGELVINITEPNVTENITEAGLDEEILENITEPEEEPEEVNITDNVTEPEVIEEVNITENVTENVTEPEVIEEVNITENVTENVTAEEINLCASVICDDSITTCPDGEIVTCENTCDNETGNCTACKPDCTGHEAAEEICTLECGKCQILDEEDCLCTTKLYCDGNKICEPSIGEWPNPDCQSFNQICSQEEFNEKLQKCEETV